MIPSGRAIQSGVIKLDSPIDLKPHEIFGGFGFRAPYWIEQDLIYTKAADDLVGAFSIVSTAIDLFKKGKSNAPFIGLLTRAEEVGYIGAIAHFEKGYFKKAKRDLVFVSLETSRTFPGAEIGKGPVVRLGDKFTPFDARSLKSFWDLAQSTLKDKVQRRIMDGGTCEGTVAMCYGYKTVGISIPLGNYHNQSFQGGPDSRGENGPAPEFVSLSDIDGLLQLCKALLKPKLFQKDPWLAKKLEFKKELKKYRPLLDAGIP